MHLFIYSCSVHTCTCFSISHLLYSQSIVFPWKRNINVMTWSSAYQHPVDTVSMGTQLIWQYEMCLNAQFWIVGGLWWCAIVYDMHTHMHLYLVVYTYSSADKSWPLFLGNANLFDGCSTCTFCWTSKKITNFRFCLKVKKI